MLTIVFEHDKFVSSMQKNLRAPDMVECSNSFLSAGNNHRTIEWSETVLNMLKHSANDNVLD